MPTVVSANCSGCMVYDPSAMAAIRVTAHIHHQFMMNVCLLCDTVYEGFTYLHCWPHFTGWSMAVIATSGKIISLK